MFKHRLVPGVLVGAALLVAAPACAAESSTDAIVAECAQGGGIQSGHTAAELSAALDDLPADVAEYTDCADQLIAAQRMVLDPTHDPSAPRATTPGFAPAATTASADGVDEAPAASAGSSASSPTPQTSVSGAVDADEPAPEGEQPIASAADPVGTKLGGLAAAGIVGASLLTLWRPAMLRRHEADEE